MDPTAADLLIHPSFVDELRHHGIDLGAQPELIGRGTFGCVYKAYHTTDAARGYPLAVKFIHSATRDEDLKHLEMLQALSHQSSADRIIPILYIGFTEKVPGAFIVTPYIAAIPPADAIRDSKLSTIRVFSRHLLQALAFCERNGLVHRDVKPRNVLWDPVRLVGYLTDFGLVDLVSEIRERAARQQARLSQKKRDLKAAGLPAKPQSSSAASATGAASRSSSTADGLLASTAAAQSVATNALHSIDGALPPSRPGPLLDGEDFAAIAMDAQAGPAVAAFIKNTVEILVTRAAAADPSGVQSNTIAAAEDDDVHYVGEPLTAEPSEREPSTSAGRELSSSVSSVGREPSSTGRTTAGPTHNTIANSSEIAPASSREVADLITCKTTDGKRSLIAEREEAFNDAARASLAGRSTASKRAFLNATPNTGLGFRGGGGSGGDGDRGSGFAPLLARDADKAGTAGFRAPEVILGYSLQTCAIDVWSAGVILLSFLTRRYPLFPGRDDLEHLLMIMQLWGEPLVTEASARLGRHILSFPSDDRLFNAPPTGVLNRFLAIIPPDRYVEEGFSDALDLCLSLLRPHPEDRITASVALACHPWFNEGVAPTQFLRLPDAFKREEEELKVLLERNLRRAKYMLAKQQGKGRQDGADIESGAANGAAADAPAVVVEAVAADVCSSTAIESSSSTAVAVQDAHGDHVYAPTPLIGPEEGQLQLANGQPPSHMNLEEGQLHHESSLMDLEKEDGNNVNVRAKSISAALGSDHDEHRNHHQLPSDDYHRNHQLLDAAYDRPYSVLGSARGSEGSDDVDANESANTSLAETDREDIEGS